MMQNLVTYNIIITELFFSILIQTSEEDTANHLLEFEIK